ncbi:fimbria/pilus outer membrane usher protein [Salmonella enterica subsp. enterica serovar Kentucky]|nr:fimbria/pilus outer membrane usher protein [Salmonella enterica subsp. enterica serovar Kentucky]
MSSDDDMLPDSMKGFAPVIRGVAKSRTGLPDFQDAD